MSTLQSKSAAKPYHHGDLRAAILAEADRMLDEGGPEAVNLREVARRVGVTVAACYRHYDSREALLVALAVTGFDAFEQALADAAGAAGADPAQALPAMGQAYVRFAVSRPGRFRLMFGTCLAERERYPALQAAVERASVGFRGAMTVSVAAPTPESTAASIGMLQAWAMVHGLAQLCIDGMLPGQDPELLARVVTTGSGKVP